MSSPDSWTTFHCENPDFTVRSVPDDISFRVNRESMRNSEVFRDMFLIGEGGSSGHEEQTVDIHETAAVLIALLRLLHYPPAPPVLKPQEENWQYGIPHHKWPKRMYDPASVIPLPLLLDLLYGLVDKYAISDAVAQTFNVHLLAHASTFPLQVYGFATAQGIDYVANEASQYLMPLASYRPHEIALIPDVLAYHKLVQLQAARVKALRDLVIGEEIFPHGYGACPSHQQETTACWEARRTALASVIETDTDIAGEMEAMAESLPKTCKACQKACTAAVQMLAYKSRKTLRRIDQLPAES
ncbi:hypothetical protein LshimejAT787_0306970 [Lyophyllum shimeji]|uniref:BTB domain-containing protein n=1 Tax=Lyophyllum shimeji TaxID=47721 RepID=A0A9P3PJ57_LYOSH|nr:hypothetical protein LshimejAT787_0306970 [Lyophyllum shimeji]